MESLCLRLVKELSIAALLTHNHSSSYNVQYSYMALMNIPQHVCAVGHVTACTPLPLSIYVDYSRSRAHKYRADPPFRVLVGGDAIHPALRNSRIIDR